MITLWGGQERRSQRRYRCCGAVKLTYPHTVTAVPAVLSDISLSGCSLQLRVPDELERNTVVELRFKTSYLTFRCLGCIRGFAPGELLVRVSFMELNKRARADILEFIHDQVEDSQTHSRFLSAQASRT